MYFYCFDAIEAKSTNQKHSFTNIYLFGKVYDQKNNNVQNCCVTVENVNRKVYIHPINNVILNILQ